MEPDCTVIVGGHAFRHYSQMLACGSDYFLGALTSGMNEAITKTIEFPQEDPEEWKIISTFFDLSAYLRLDMPKPAITEANIEMLLPWFDRLCATSLLEQCDEFYQKNILVARRVRSSTFGESHTKIYPKPPLLLTALESAIRYSLNGTKDEAITLLRGIIDKLPGAFDGLAIMRLVKVCLEDNACRTNLWPHIKKYLPEQMREDERTAEGPPTFLRDEHSHPDCMWMFCTTLENGFKKAQCSDAGFSFGPSNVGY